MRLQLLELNSSGKIGAHKFQKTNSKKIPGYFLTLLIVLFAFSMQVHAQGTWTAVSTLSPNQNGGGMLLLSDGSVLCKSFGGGSDGIGNIFDRLTPDVNGSYANGTWTSIASM